MPELNIKQEFGKTYIVTDFYQTEEEYSKMTFLSCSFRFKSFIKGQKTGNSEHGDLNPQRDVADRTGYISIAFVEPEEAWAEEVDDKGYDFKDKEALTEQIEEAAFPVLHPQMFHKIPV